MRDKKTYIIAEAGVNHNGSIDMAMGLIDAAADAGADAVKFQTFRAEDLVSHSAAKADYQTRATGAAESQFEMLKKLELTEAAHRELIRHCEKKGVQFLSTPFDLKSLSFLAGSLDISRLKIPSGELTNGPLLLGAARTGKPIILSTGMGTLAEVETALGAVSFGYTSHKEAVPSIEAFMEAYRSEAGQMALREKVVLLHCTTEYPAPMKDVNLRAMETLRSSFGLPVGFSDHTTGIAISIAAAALGATIIEKHITLDRRLPGPDHRASLEPYEFKELVAAVASIEAAMGSSLKAPAPSEIKNISVARKSIVAGRAIKKGEIFTEENLTAKRPGTGLSPMYYWELIGSAAKRDYSIDEPVER